METSIASIRIKNTVAQQQEILTDEALQFLIALHETFDDQRKALLSKRKDRLLKFQSGVLPNFLPHREDVADSTWRVAPVPADLQDRRVEITGPVDRKMVINALNSGAQTFMADFEDSNSPTWENCINGQINLRDAILGTITFENDRGKKYQLNENPATLLVRPRGWHLEEKNITYHGKRLSASLVDFGLFFFHNAKTLLEKGSGPYFYLPKLESHLEARLWNDVFVFAQNYMGIEQGTIKATVLIETLTAAFEMDEILYELRQHSAGLNCGRWDYIFSVIKNLKRHPDFVLPNRDLVTMEAPFMHAYSKLVIKTCHRRGAHAIGGMSAFIPVKNNETKNNQAIEKVLKDKTREVLDGHDGSWVAHPGLVQVVRDVFNQHMPEANQISKQVPEEINQGDLLKMPEGNITEEGIRKNINVGLLYIESWLRGTGAAALYHMMEDAATAEISRAQLWQWLQHKAQLTDGRTVTKELLEVLFYQEQKKVRELLEGIPANRLENASILFRELIFQDEFQDFLTLKAYELI